MTTTYLDLYREALRAYWAEPVKPADVANLHRLCESVLYTAPELLMGQAWGIFEEHGDTEIGRAAVAFTWALALDHKEACDKAPVRADDDGPELAAIASDVRPVVDAGKGRALAFEVVRAMIWIFMAPVAGGFSPWLSQRFADLARWCARALDIDAGHEAKLDPADRLSLLDVAGIADRIASAALCQARAGLPVPFERWVVFDIATALRRACGCSDMKAEILTVHRMLAAGSEDIAQAADELRDDFDHTANTLLPLLIRDARRLCAAAKVDVAPIEAAIARHGGRPS